MSKIYIKNLPSDFTEEQLCKAFNQMNIDLTDVSINAKGFAFADCKDAASCEKALDSMNGFSIGGKGISVEMQVPKDSRPRRIYVRNIPSHLNWEELDSMLGSFGKVENCEQVSSEGDTAAVKVTYVEYQHAQMAYRELGKRVVSGQNLYVSMIPDPSDVTRPARPRNFMNGGYGQPNGYANGGNFRQKPLPELPTRMLVPSQFVGAIIGKGGECIRAITQKTHARIDVHRKDNPGATEKAITINGSVEACGEAVASIFDIIKEEEKSARANEGGFVEDGRNELPLKILAHNSLIGRLIGKEGRNLKTIQEKTGCRIAISNGVGEMHTNNSERTVSIYGEECAKAELLLMEKLRSCYENDMRAAYQQPLSFPGMGMNPVSMFPGINSFGMRGDGLGGSGYNYRNGPNMAGDAAKVPSETCTLYIPAESVGAMIGSKGAHIRNVSRMANTSIKIVNPEDNDDDKLRRLTIMGSPEGQWRSQYCIFEKLKQEGYFQSDHDMRLTSEMMIPASIVGRLIGKGGNNVRELQRITGSEVVIPRQSETEGMEQVPVKMNGHFYSIQSAQRKIREVLNKANAVEEMKTRMQNSSSDVGAN